MELTAEQSRAHGLFIQHKKIDPFPEIKPALLNWDDIIRYVDKTGMIFPFNKEDLRPGSYEVRLLGRCIYFDDRQEKHDIIIDKGDEFKVKKKLDSFPDYRAFNSITRLYSRQVQFEG